MTQHGKTDNANHDGGSAGCQPAVSPVRHSSAAEAGPIGNRQGVAVVGASGILEISGEKNSLGSAGEIRRRIGASTAAKAMVDRMTDRQPAALCYPLLAALSERDLAVFSPAHTRAGNSRRLKFCATIAGDPYEFTSPLWKSPHIETGWTVIDEFCARFVYFYTGYILATRVFQIAGAAQARPWTAAVALLVWAWLNGFYVSLGLDGKPFISLTLGLIGAAAVVTISALIAKFDLAAPLRWLGKNSIVVYLAFFLGMAASRSVLLKTGIIGDLGTVALLVTACGIAGAVLWFLAVRRTPLRFLFERPAWAHLKDKPRYALQPAE